VINAKDHPAFTEKAARLALMDAQGVEATIMLPTMGSPSSTTCATTSS
jgi:hypothetical protein